MVVATKKERYWYDAERETLVKEADGKQSALGCGKIVVKATYKAETDIHVEVRTGVRRLIHVQDDGCGSRRPRRPWPSHAMPRASSRPPTT